MPPQMTIPTAAELRERAAGQTPHQHYARVEQARRDRFDAMDALMYTAQIEGRDLHASEARDYDTHDNELRRLDILSRTITSNHPEVIAVDRSVLSPDPTQRLIGAGTSSYATGQPLARDQTMVGFANATRELRDEQRDLSLSKFIRGMVTGKWDDAGNERMAMTEGTQSGGGVLVPTLLSAQIIDLARNTAAVLQAGARLFPMESSKVDVAKWVQDPTPAWHTESTLIPSSDAALSKITLQAKTLAGVTVVSRELIEDATELANELKLAFAAQYALTVDRAALYGAGTGPEPLGVKNTNGVTQTVLGGGANGASLSTSGYDWLVDAVGRRADVNEIANAVVYSPRTARSIGKLKDNTGQPLQAPDYIAALARFATNQVPNNLTVGTSTDTSDAFVADWTQLYVGVRTELVIQPLVERYADFGQVGFLTWWRGDIQVARATAFDVTTGIRP